MTQDPGSAPLALEDEKLVTLARAARARVGVLAGAAVRDQTGRVYAAATVALPSLRLSALQVAVAMAVAAGAEALEAAVVVAETPALADDPGLPAAQDLNVRLLLQAGLDGKVIAGS